MDPTHLPRHVAIIMDGNGRWATAQTLPRLEGHRRGVEASEEIITYASELHIGYLTLYAFSRENWNRPPEEIKGLMELLHEFLISKKQKMLDNNIRLNAIGDKSLLPQNIQDTLAHTMGAMARSTGMVLTLALSYGSRDELVRAMKKILGESVKDKALVEGFNQGVLEKHLDTAGMPDPDLIIRTGGEYRLSNFLLWQGAYAECIFQECLWPDFTREHFLAALKEYQSRERRFGKTSEQLR